MEIIMKILILKEFEIISNGSQCDKDGVNCDHLDGARWCHLFKDLDGYHVRHNDCIVAEKLFNRVNENLK